MNDWLRALFSMGERTSARPQFANAELIEAIPSDWTKHPAFAGAHEVIALRPSIERALRNAIKNMRSEGEALNHAIGALPAWPQYDETRARLSEEDAPIWWTPGWEMPDSDDGIAQFQIATLRERAKPYGIKGRSKAEIAARLREVLPANVAEALAADGSADWQARVDVRERRKFCEVLAHTVQMASSSIRSARQRQAYGRARTRLRWLSGPCCKLCDKANDAVREIGVPFPFVDVVLSPAHPGCCCIEISATPP